MTHQHLSDHGTRCQANDEADEHARKDGDDGFMDGPYVPYLEVVRGPQREDEQHAHEEQRPQRVVLFLFRDGGIGRLGLGGLERKGPQWESHGRLGLG